MCIGRKRCFGWHEALRKADDQELSAGDQHVAYGDSVIHKRSWWVVAEHTSIAVTLLSNTSDSLPVRSGRVHCCTDHPCVGEQIPPEELEFRGDPDNRKDVMANRKRIQVLSVSEITVP